MPSPTSSSAGHWPPRPELRLFQGDHDQEPAAADPPDGVSPAMSLTQFVLRWYMPVRQSSNRQPSRDRVLDSLKLWAQITGDPPISAINDYVLARWDAGLAAATYRRGKLGQALPYAKKTIELHQRNVQAILYTLGPRLDRKRITAKLIDDPPYRPIVISRAPRKPPFSWPDVQKIFAAVEQMTKPVLPAVSAPQWWRAWEGWLFATGQRPGTVWGLQWPFLKESAAGWYLDIPDEFVTKEHAAVQVPLPQWAVDVVQSWPRSSGRIFACGITYGTMAQWHAELQAKAGVSLPMSPRAWKRTHIEVLKRMGVRHVRELMRTAGNHADFATTSESYSADPLDEFRRMLPCPWEGARQKELF